MAFNNKRYKSESLKILDVNGNYSYVSRENIVLLFLDSSKFRINFIHLIKSLRIQNHQKSKSLL